MKWKQRRMCALCVFECGVFIAYERLQSINKIQKVATNIE